MKRTRSLLDKALAVPTTRAVAPISDEIVDLAVAWAEGKVRGVQVEHALGGSKGRNSYVFLARGLAEAWRRRNAK